MALILPLSNKTQEGSQETTSCILEPLTIGTKMSVANKSRRGHGVWRGCRAYIGSLLAPPPPPIPTPSSSLPPGKTNDPLRTRTNPLIRPGAAVDRPIMADDPWCRPQTWAPSLMAVRKQRSRPQLEGARPG